MKFLKKEKTSSHYLKTHISDAWYAAFTLAELIIAVLIGALVLSILMSFITTSMNEITYSNKQTEIIGQINNLSTTVNNYKWTFEDAQVLIDRTWTGSDVIMMTNPEQNEWIIIWVVDNTTLTLVESAGAYDTISEKYIWIRQLTQADIVSLNTSPNTVFDLNFNQDKLIHDLIMKDLQVTAYNSWSVLDTDLFILINYKDSIDWENWENVTNDWIYKVNMNF